MNKLRWKISLLISRLAWSIYKVEIKEKVASQP